MIFVDRIGSCEILKVFFMNGRPETSNIGAAGCEGRAATVSSACVDPGAEGDDCCGVEGE